MLLALARVFFLEPALGLLRTVSRELTVCGRLFWRVFNPDVGQHPTENGIVANAKEFFRFISFCIVVQLSALELAGEDSDLVAEASKFVLLLGAYLFGFSANYVIAYVGRLWSKGDFLSSVNAISDFYNLIFWIVFMVNLVFGKIDPVNPGDGGMQSRAFSAFFFAIGAIFFVTLRVKKNPTHGLTWLLIMAVDFCIHWFNLFLLNQVVYQPA